jgi:hypothetical protein
MIPTSPLRVQADLPLPFEGEAAHAAFGASFAPHDLGAPDGGRHVATEMTLQLFASEPRLRVLLERGLTPSLQAPRIARLEPGARYDHARCELRLNRYGPGPLLAQIGFYLEGRLIACASQRGALLPPISPSGRSVS